MTLGVGGKTQEQALNSLANMATEIEPIQSQEFQNRIDKAVQLMREQAISHMYVNAGTNLAYFTGASWYASERLVGAVLTDKGELHFILPHFELDTFKALPKIRGQYHTWEEHQSPFALVAELLTRGNRLAIDESTPFFIFNGIHKAIGNIELQDAKSVISACRQQKSAAELAIMQTAKKLTLEVQKAAASMLRSGISTLEVEDFIHRAHIKAGAPKGSYFCIVLFGEPTAYPHGVDYPQYLEEGDMVLIDTGCELAGYKSDITRSYVFGTPTNKQRQIWELEKAAQLAAFEAAQPGVSCEAVDAAARSLIESAGFGPDYQLPGLPHRTGHGIGLDIHEWPYLVRGEKQALQAGMCFSNEPMICIPGEFGVRLEDHFYMTAEGPKWFTQPSHSLDNPFGLKE